MIHITQACVDLLAAAVNECDAMMLAEDRRNDIERAHSRLADSVRVPHHTERRKALRDHRANLVNAYVKMTGKDPWANIPL